MTLLPGDVISTGTPAGVGLGLPPPRYLRPGDVVELGVEGLGTSRQRRGGRRVSPVRMDAHQHFWRYDAARDTWITDEMAVLRRDFLPGELASVSWRPAWTGAWRCKPTPPRTRPASSWTWRSDDFVRGVVGWVDLRAPDVDAARGALAANPHLCGIRHIVQAEADDYLVRDDVCGASRGSARPASPTTCWCTRASFLPSSRSWSVCRAAAGGGPHRQAGDRRGPRRALGGPHAGAGGARQRMVQGVRDGHRGRLDAVATGGAARVPGRGVRGVRRRAASFRLGLARVPAGGGVRGAWSAWCRSTQRASARRSVPALFGDNARRFYGLDAQGAGRTYMSWDCGWCSSPEAPRGSARPSPARWPARAPARHRGPGSRGGRNAVQRTRGRRLPPSGGRPEGGRRLRARGQQAPPPRAPSMRW